MWIGSARQVPSRQSEDIPARGARRAPCGGDVNGGPILGEPVGGGVSGSDVPGRQAGLVNVKLHARWSLLRRGHWEHWANESAWGRVCVWGCSCVCGAWMV